MTYALWIVQGLLASSVHESDYAVPVSEARGRSSVSRPCYAGPEDETTCRDTSARTILDDKS
jgi:hypothetical protein